MSCEECRHALWIAGPAHTGLAGPDRVAPVPDPAGVSADGLSRRAFMERVTLAAIGVALAACETGLPTGPDLPTGGPYSVTVSDYPSLGHVGGVAKVTLSDGSVVGVGRVAPNEFAAYGLACTHQGTQVNVSGDGWLCPSHGAEFATSGAVTRGPAARALYSVPAAYDATTGILTVNGTAAAGAPATGGEDDSEGDDD